MTKTCEVCKKPIPDDFSNLLCWEHYAVVAEDNDRHKKMAEEEKEAKMKAISEDLDKNRESLPHQVSAPINAKESQIEVSAQGITDPHYQENPEKEDKEQWKSNIIQFDKSGHLLWHPTKAMYEFIKTEQLNRITQHPQYPKFIWKPKIVDVGCGIGIGSNILSQEADFVWGIDKNEKSVLFAKQCFTREKNNIYYSSQVTYDQIDIMKDTREFLKFDVVCAIEIIEHIADAKGFLKIIIDKFNKTGKGDPTEYWISTPNRDNDRISKEKPKNSYHVREWTSSEFVNMLKEHFKTIKLYNSSGIPVEIGTEHTPILARCQV